MPTPAPICVIGSATNTTNVDLVRSWGAAGLQAFLRSPLDTLPTGTVAIGRLDVLPTLDGVEPGLLALLLLGRRGARVLNTAEALVTVHNKLMTARCLARAGLPHPRTVGWRGKGQPPLPPPFVLKPCFGSWGRDVFLCQDSDAVPPTLQEVRRRPWFRRHGAVLQDFVATRGYDLRLIVAGGQVVGARRRVAADGEWRTNVSLGGSVHPLDPSAAARCLAVAAASAVGIDFVGVDLLPTDDGYVVIELNGAVEFDHAYSLSRQGIYLDAADALGISQTAVDEAARAEREQRSRDMHRRAELVHEQAAAGRHER